MGDLDQFAKLTFAEETALITQGAITWELPSELRLSEVRLDGLLLVRSGHKLRRLPSPWRYACSHKEIVIELKMQGDHLDRLMLERALLRRQAYQVRLVEDAALADERHNPLWIIAAHVPAMLRKLHKLKRLAAGCYVIKNTYFEILWIAANELPLREALIPFLVARTGKALDEFGLWVLSRRSPDWLSRMLQFLPMSLPVQEELLRYMIPLTDDPEVRARQRHMARFINQRVPEVRDELIEEGLKPLAHLLERRLGRTLTEDEHHLLRERLGRLGANRLGDVVLDLSPEALDAWLADPNAT